MVDLDGTTAKPLKKPSILDDEDDIEDKTMTEYGNAALWVSLFTGLCLIMMCIATFFIIRKMRKNEKKEIDRVSTGTGTETKSTDQKKEFDTVQRRMSLKTMASKNLPLESIIIQQHKSHASRTLISKKSERNAEVKETDTSITSRRSLSKKSQKTRDVEGVKDTSSKKSEKEKNSDVVVEPPPSSMRTAAKKTSRYEKVGRRSAASTTDSMQTASRSPVFKSTTQRGSKSRGTEPSKLK